MSMEKDLRDAILKERIQEPLVFQGFLKSWPCLNWDQDKWKQILGDQKLAFRYASLESIFRDPTKQVFEGACETQDCSLTEFLDWIEGRKRKKLFGGSTHNDIWAYYDYKYMNEEFLQNGELLQAINWRNLGFPERTGKESVLWIGSKGSHSPGHYDTYGSNLVAQLHGRKLWILFPPECTRQLRPTRIPYEESSVYSEINLYAILSRGFECVTSVDLSSLMPRFCIMEPGMNLYVPKHWWHYVIALDPFTVSVNTWIELASDNRDRLKEALVASVIRGFCHDASNHDVRCLLNPNEYQLLGESQSDVLSLVESSLKAIAASEPRIRDNESESKYECCDPKVSPLPTSSFFDLMEAWKLHFQPDMNDHVDTAPTTLDAKQRMCIINAFTQPVILEQVVQNLLQEN